MNIPFNQWILEELKKKDWSQADLAYRAGVSRTAISDVISEKRSPGPDLCSAIASALGYPPELVFRKAGLLPPKPNEDVTLEEWLYIMRQLPDEDREELLEIARLKLERRANIKKGLRRGAEGTI